MAKEKTRAELREEIEQLKAKLFSESEMHKDALRKEHKKLEEAADNWAPMYTEYVELKKKIADFDAVANYHKKEAENLRKQVAELDEVIKQQKKSNTDLAGRLIDKQNECEVLSEDNNALLSLIKGNLFRLIIEHYRQVLKK